MATVSLAQPGHWRIGVQMGKTYPGSATRITPELPDSRFLQFDVRTATMWQVTADRSVGRHLSVRAGYGSVRMPYQISTLKELRNSAGQLRSLSGSSLGGGTVYSVGTLGVTVNTSSYGPVILTSGLDLNIRFRNSNRGSSKFGGYGTSTIILPPDTFKVVEAYLFNTGLVPAMTFALAPHVGMDVRLLNRTFLTLNAQYIIGLGNVVKGVSDDILLNGQAYAGGFESRGSGWAWQIGLRQTLGKVKPNSGLTYTPYNQPQTRTPWSEDERQGTFAKGTGLVGIRGTYGRGNLFRNHMDVQLRGGYFVLNRLLVGLNGQWFHDWSNHYGFNVRRTYYFVGPLARYHLTRSRLSPFVEASYQTGRFSYRSNSIGGAIAGNGTTKASSWVFSPGVSGRLSKQLRADLALNWQTIRSNPRSGSFQDTRLQLGLNYLISTKRVASR